MKKIGIISLVLLSMVILMGSCKKYDQGGLMGKAEKRVKQQWKLESYYLDGNDATSSLLISTLVEEYKEDGSYVRSYIDKDGNPFTETGQWSLDADKDKISIMSVSSLELSAEHSTISTSSYDILRLKKKEFWYSYSNGGATHEFRMIPNEE